MEKTSIHELVTRIVVLQFLVPGIWSSLWSAEPRNSAVVSAGVPIQFQLSDGDNVTCVAIEEQTSLRHSNFSRVWNRYPTTEVFPGNSTDDSHGSKPTQQTIASEEGGCPDGSIPVRAHRGSWDIGMSPVRRRGFSSFHTSSTDDQTPHERTCSVNSFHGGSSENVESSYDLSADLTWAFVESDTKNKGTEVFMNVWKPFVESEQEFSLAQLWLVGGVNSSLNTIEVGYQISSGHYGDGLSRLFVYWTADDYNTTGCYDLNCPGFVQVSNKVLLGGSFTPVSRQLGQMYEIKLRVFKDNMGTGDWWLQLNDENVGYWPRDIFVTLQDSADVIQWGGEIVDDEGADGGLHTRTEMGSGQNASAGFGRAAYQRNLQYIDDSNSLVDAPFKVYSVPNATCYSAEKETQFSDWGSYFFFGGKGRSSQCLRDPAFQS